MSILFDKRLKSICPGQIQELQCHQVFSRLAVAYLDKDMQTSSIVVFKEGVALSESVITRSALVKVLSWHPTQMTLAIGWQCGQITLQNMHDYSLHDVDTPHSLSNLSVMLWSCDGSHLLVGYSMGWMSIWKVNERAHVQETASNHQILDECPMMAVALASHVSGPSSDLTLLAKAAMSGDVEALDFCPWKPLPRSFRTEETEVDGFIVAGANGKVWHVSLIGQITECFQTNEPIRRLLVNNQRNVLVTLTSSFMLMMHEILGNGKLKESLKMKLTGDLASADLVWAGRSTLAVSTGKETVRMFDVDTQDNFSLQIERCASAEDTEPEMINCISYSETKGLLAGGTDRGRICLWNYIPGPVAGAKKCEPATNWHLQIASVVSEPIVSLQFGSSRSCLIASSATDVFVLEERKPCCFCSHGTSIVQTGARQLSVDVYSLSSHFEITTDIQVRQLYATKTHVAVYDGQKVTTYDLFSAEDTTESFNVTCSGICIYERSIFTAHSGHILVRNLQGVVKQLLKLPFPDDEILSMDVCGCFLVVGVLSGFLLVYDLSRREVRRQWEAKCLRDSIADFGHIVSAKCNADASRVSVIVNKSDGSRDPRLHIWDAESDTVAFFNFFTGSSSLDECEKDAVASSNNGLQSYQRLDAETCISCCVPVSHFWDPEEARLLACETNCIWDFDDNWPPIATCASREDGASATVTILCGQDDSSLRVQNVFVNEKFCQQLLSLDLPFYYYAKKAGTSCPDVNENPKKSSPLFSEIGNSSTTVRRIHGNFVGLEKADDATRGTMLNFTVSMTLGKLDEAFRAIASIKSFAVWENLAKTCVQNRRLDVARVCLAKMGNARAVKMLRESEKEPEVEVQLATLAIQLGLYVDAVELMRAAGRYDMLNNFYQSQGLWLQAISLAQTFDRLNLRTTCYNYAKYLESIGLRIDAIGYYEKSGTHGREVPRMMLCDLEFLKNYIHKNNDRTLLRWLGQYLESDGQMEAATKCFEAAGDYLSMVRIYCCHLNDFAQALDLCRWTGDAAACFFLGQMYEQRAQYEEALALFMRARSYGRAIRIAMQQHYDDKLVYMALLGSRDDMIEVAGHLESNPKHVDAAVMLYHRAGLVSRAVELALASQSSAALQFISENLEEMSDPQLSSRCAQFFVSTSQFDRAVSLLATAGKYDEAIRICQTKHVPMTDALVEKLTPKDLGELDPARRNEVLEAIAEVCVAQGEYRLAATKFHQAKNSLKSMKALIRHGDTDLVIRFAKVSQQGELFILAANYLQSVDWQTDNKLISHIVHFYDKAEAFQSLAGFYETCAQVEISDYRNYKKAFQALVLSARCLGQDCRDNAPTEAAKVAVEERIEDIQKRLLLINQFISAQSQNDESSIEICRNLLASNCDDAIFKADIYGYMVEYYATNLCWNQAYEVLDEMRMTLSGVNAANHISCSVLEAMEQAMSRPRNASTGSGLKAERSEEADDDESGLEELDSKKCAS